MATITLADIRLRSRQKADMVNSNYIKDDEQLSYINEAYFNWYDVVVSAFEDYNLDEPTDFTIASGVSTFPLPADFYKLAGIDKKGGGGADGFYTLKNFPWRSRNRETSTISARGYYLNVGYRITKDVIRFIPTDQADGQYRLWYVPLATALVDPGDTVEKYNGLEELIVIDTAIRMLDKEESDTKALLLQRAFQEKRMQNMLIDRDINDGDRIEEVSHNRYDGGYW